MYIEMLTNLGIAIGILLVALILGNWIKNRITNLKKLDITLRSFLGSMAKHVILAIAVISILQQFGVQTASLIAVLGAAGLAIGLALQGTLSDVAAGVMLLIFRPFNVGDTIEFSGTTGTVKSLGLFASELTTADNIYMYTPNSQIWTSTISNFSRNAKRRHDLSFGISYDDNLDAAMHTLTQAIESHDGVLQTSDSKPAVMLENLSASSVDIKVRFWTRGDHLGIKHAVMKSLKEALETHGFNFPYPTQTVTFANENENETRALKPASTAKKTPRTTRKAS